MSRKITQTISLAQPPETVFHALITPSMIQKWWSAAYAVIIPENGGLYAVTWGDDIDSPDYITAAKIKKIDSPIGLHLHEFTYKSKGGGLPFEAELEVEFILEGKSGNTDLTVIQSGFPDEKIADMYYEGCVKGWEDTLSSVRETLKKI